MSRNKNTAEKIIKNAIDGFKNEANVPLAARNIWSLHTKIWEELRQHVDADWKQHAAGEVLPGFAVVN